MNTTAPAFSRADLALRDAALDSQWSGMPLTLPAAAAIYTAAGGNPQSMKLTADRLGLVVDHASTPRLIFARIEVANKHAADRESRDEVMVPTAAAPSDPAPTPAPPPRAAIPTPPAAKRYTPPPIPVQVRPQADPRAVRARAIRNSPYAVGRRELVEMIVAGSLPTDQAIVELECRATGRVSGPPSRLSTIAR